MGVKKDVNPSFSPNNPSYVLNMGLFTNYKVMAVMEKDIRVVTFGMGEHRLRGEQGLSLVQTNIFYIFPWPCGCDKVYCWIYFEHIV